MPADRRDWWGVAAVFASGENKRRNYPAPRQKVHDIRGAVGV